MQEIKLSSLADYVTKCKHLKPKQLQLDELQEVLVARDSVAVDAINLSKDERNALFEADNTLQQSASKSSQIRANCNNLRQTLKPIETSWWWNLDKVEPHEPKWSILCILASLIFFSLTFSVVTDITSRFVKGPLDSGSISALALQVLLTIGAGSTMTSWAKKWLRSIWKDLKLPIDASYLAAPIAATLLFSAAYGFQMLLPNFASMYAKAATTQLGLAESISLLKKAVALDPKSSAHQLELARRLERKGDIDGAISAFELAVGLDKNNTRAQVDLAHSYLAKEPPDFAKASNLLLHQMPEDIRKSPDLTTRALFHNHLAWVMLGQELIPEAIGNAKLAIKSKPLAESHAILAHIYQLKNDDRAASQWREALSLYYSDSTNVPAYHWQEEIALNTARLKR